ncbi:MAG: hypothetical protein AB3N28_15700, partial [Kordiimonas sp.]
MTLDSAGDGTITSSSGDVQITYGRDNLGRITSEDISNSDYVFDAHAFTTGNVTIPAANDNNQYSMFDGLVNVYDAAGNLTDDGRFEYEFDAVRVADGSTYWSAPSKP